MDRDTLKPLRDVTLAMMMANTLAYHVMNDSLNELRTDEIRNLAEEWRDRQQAKDGSMDG